jgi:hypothetical protein
VWSTAIRSWTDSRTLQGRWKVTAEERDVIGEDNRGGA